MRIARLRPGSNQASHSGRDGSRRRRYSRAQACSSVRRRTRARFMHRSCRPGNAPSIPARPHKRHLRVGGSGPDIRPLLVVQGCGLGPPCSRDPDGNNLGSQATTLVKGINRIGGQPARPDRIPTWDVLSGPADASSNATTTSVSAGQSLRGATRRNRTADPILTMEPPGTAVRNAISPARARPLVLKLSVLSWRGYALTFRSCCSPQR